MPPLPAPCTRSNPVSGIASFFASFCWPSRVPHGGVLRLRHGGVSPHPRPPTPMTALSPSVGAAARGEPMRAAPGMFDRFAALSGALEQAAAAVARLDVLLTGHPLAAAWLWRIRLDAVRHHAACDGLMIDPWHLAAMIEGVRFRMDRAAAIIDRGAIFEAARHAFGLWRWFVQPDATQTQAIEHAGAALSASGQVSPLLGAALGVRAWLDDGGERPA